MIRAGIFGPSMCGKTTLARHLSRAYWCRYRVPSLVLDPHLESWGPQSWVTTDEEVFWDVVWHKRRGCLVIVEEAAATIRRERELVPLFTRLRHLDHKLLVCGHDGTDLLPTMRRNFDELFLFLQPSSAVELWQGDIPDMAGVEAACSLHRYEFLHCRKFSQAQRKRLGETEAAT